MDSESSVCKTMSSNSPYLNIFLLVTGCSGHSSIFCRIHTTSELGKPLLSKRHFQHFEVSIALVLQLKVNISVGMLYFQVFQLIGMPKLQMQQHTLVHYKISLKNSNCYSLIQSRKWLSRLYSRYTYG